MKFENIPRPLDEEIALLKRIKNESAERGINFFRWLSNAETKALGSVMAKCHLEKVQEYIKASKSKRFSVDFFCYNLRIFEAGNKESVLVLSNYGFGDITMYNIGYGQVIDAFFEEPIV